MVLVGVALFTYGVMDFSSSQGPFEEIAPSHGYSYLLPARLEASLGALLVVAGIMLRRNEGR